MLNSIQNKTDRDFDLDLAILSEAPKPMVDLGFFTHDPYFDHRFPAVERLLNPKSDLRRAYTRLTGEDAPDTWRNPDWVNVDAQKLAAIIAQDLLSALAERGIRGGDYYMIFTYGHGDDVGNTEICEEVYEDFVRAVSQQAVAYRVQRYRASE